MKKIYTPSFSLSRALLLWSQQILHLFPFILWVIAISVLLVGILGLLQHHPSVKFGGTIHQQMVQIQKRVWSIAKDPSSRATQLTPPSSLNIYEDALSPEEEEIIKPTLIIKETWKEDGLLNLKEFRWLMNNESICKPDGKSPNDTRILPVLIHTFRDHFTARAAIRKTWGSIPIYKKWDVRLVFLLGEPDHKKDTIEATSEELSDNPDYRLSDDEVEEEKLQDELHQFGDLVMGNFQDNVRNLTYKHMMGYKWILNYCSDAAFVMKVDDDRFVDIIQWLDWRSKDLKILEERNKSNGDDVDVVDEQTRVPDLYCNLFVGGIPIRQEENSWYASMEDWPENQFPNYCSSWAYGTTMDLIKKQYSVSNERKFFWIDDVYFGALLEKVKEKYDWYPVISDCFKTQMGGEDKYRGVCTSDGKVNLDEKREFGPVVMVNGGEGFERDMMCLWNKTVYDIHEKFDTE